VDSSVRRIGVGLLTCALVTAGVLSATAPAASSAPAGGCQSGSIAPACLKAGQPCKAANRADYSRFGFVCSSGRLHKRVATAPPASIPATTTAITTTAPPLPPPSVPPGHYAGTTSQGHSIQFDVKPDGRNLTNIVARELDETCAPSRSWTYPGFETGGFDYPLLASGAFHLNGGSRNIDAGISSSTKITMSAGWTGGQAQGTYAVTTAFTDQGTAYACTGSVSWTAGLT
jgi:hypothetical protein